MDALEMTLLYDYYGDLLTERQRMCFDLYHNQDFSLAEIAQELQVPVKFVGLGEGMDDLQPFDAMEFLEAMI